VQTTLAWRHRGIFAQATGRGADDRLVASATTTLSLTVRVGFRGVTMAGAWPDVIGESI
jgi:hypothetical protein